MTDTELIKAWAWAVQQITDKHAANAVGALLLTEITVRRNDDKWRATLESSLLKWQKIDLQIAVQAVCPWLTRGAVGDLSKKDLIGYLITREAGQQEAIQRYGAREPVKRYGA